MQVTCYESPCHLIFEKSACNFYVTTHDVSFEVDAVCRKGNTHAHSRRTIVDHNEYISCIQAYANQGWDLAGMIHMENISKPIDSYTRKSIHYKTFWSTIRLIFQSPAREDNPGGIL